MRLGTAPEDASVRSKALVTSPVVKASTLDVPTGCVPADEDGVPTRQAVLVAEEEEPRAPPATAGIGPNHGAIRATGVTAVEPVPASSDHVRVFERASCMR